MIARAKSELAWVTIRVAAFGELIERDKISPEEGGRELRNVRILFETFVVQLGVYVGTRGQQRRDSDGHSRSRQEVHHPDGQLTFEFGEYVVVR